MTRRISAAQRNLQLGDCVKYERDDGTEILCQVTRSPFRLGDAHGTLVVWLRGIRGDVALCRCKPIRFRPAAMREPAR